MDDNYKIKNDSSVSAAVVVKCPDCGQKISSNHKICPICNYELKEKELVELLNSPICQKCGEKIFSTNLKDLKKKDDNFYEFLCNKCYSPINVKKEELPNISIKCPNCYCEKKISAKTYICPECHHPLDLDGLIDQRMKDKTREKKGCLVGCLGMLLFMGLILLALGNFDGAAFLVIGFIGILIVRCTFSKEEKQDSDKFLDGLFQKSEKKNKEGKKD